MASQPKQEKRKAEEPMAHKQEVSPVVPPVFPEETEGEAVVTQVPAEVVVPPTDENAPKEKALVPDSQKTAEGVPTKNNDGQTSASKPSTPEKMKGPLLHSSPLMKIWQHLMMLGLRQ